MYIARPGLPAPAWHCGRCAGAAPARPATPLLVAGSTEAALRLG